MAVNLFRDDAVQVEPFDDLPVVMHEVAETMSAKWCALSMHPTLDRPPSLLFADPELDRFGDDLILRLADEYLADTPGAERWHTITADSLTLFRIKVDPIKGHARMVITLAFDQPTAEQRKWAEAIYDARKPFAVGYFRLWQTNRIRQRLSDQLAAVLDMTEIGVLLLDQEGDIAFVNDAAAGILAQEDGLRRRGRSVRATQMSDAVALQIALEHVMQAPGTSSCADRVSSPVLALRRTAGPPLIVALLPTQTPAAEPSDIAAIVYIVDPQQDVSRMLAPLCRLYRLSRTESLLVANLVAGRSIGEIAETMRVKEQTARGYLRQVFIKTSTNRQTELIVLMLSSLVRMKETVIQEALGID